MRLSHRLEYIGLVGFSKLLCVIPRRIALRFGSAIGSFAWAIGIRKELVLANIARARPEASRDALEKIGKQAAKNFGRTVTEFIRYGIKDRDLVPSLVTIEGLETLKETLGEGKGALVLTGHHGAWAIYFAAISMSGIPLSLLVGKQHNEKVDEFILKIPGDRVEFISKGRAAVKKILNKLNEGRAVVMVSDQHAGKHGVVVPFLGEEASTLPLPGSFAIKYNIPVFIMTGQRLENGNHLVKIDKLEIPEMENDDERKVEVLRLYNKKMGDTVAACPEQYFWYHRRWREEDKKSQPE